MYRPPLAGVHAVMTVIAGGIVFGGIGVALKWWNDPGSSAR
jgi:hypothetical protein